MMHHGRENPPWANSSWTNLLQGNRRTALEKAAGKDAWAQLTEHGVNVILGERLVVLLGGVCGVFAEDAVVIGDGTHA